jgi:hypothetical protein
MLSRSLSALGPRTQFVNSFFFSNLVTVNIEACHHGMTLSHVGDEEGGPQSWRAAMNILIKQSLTSDMRVVLRQ